VTTGSLWNFLTLSGQTARVDSREYSIEKPEKILGILLRMAAPPTG